ncbi:hypothetical protein DFA_04671 [Cavenderia fasciculata]|uniref:Uncharacterized protein n=1 Tax=Cavenderia fasciculata TaxID=261658 RepID=F4PQ78_CACFS|nr:uncharacterized protein DFA_04671 [Cavenderia fasciculata]EGG22541.1 hypothetical protein DFA_04671 [Cavenderia fasciculata]|eukprot:XP_004360392.1 hypothetical protein DFA_04671 [Cavenderia fasciculata]
MYFFRKSNNTTQNQYTTKHEDDEFVMVNNGITQSGWVDVNNSIVEPDKSTLPIYQIRRQELQDEQEQEEEQEEDQIIQQPERAVVVELLPVSIVKQSSIIDQVAFDQEEEEKETETIKVKEEEIIIQQEEPQPQPQPEPVAVVVVPIVPAQVIKEEQQEQVTPVIPFSTKSQSGNSYSSSTTNFSPFFKRVSSGTSLYSTTGSNVGSPNGVSRVSSNTSYSSSSTEVKPFSSASVATTSYSS